MTTNNNNVRDLFGEIPVSLEELLAWMLAVPGIPPSSPRFALYIRGYQVIEKIQAAKARGELEQILAGDQASAPARLEASIQFGRRCSKYLA